MPGSLPLSRVVRVRWVAYDVRYVLGREVKRRVALGVPFAALTMLIAVALTPARTQVPTACAYQAGGALPDPKCTPGAINHSVTQGDIRSTICSPGWATMVRDQAGPSHGDKVASMRQYGVGDQPTGSFEYDHLISIELGGAVNDPRNLWPESVSPVGGDGWKVKDSVENRLHADVCAGRVTLRQARSIIRHDWRVGLAKP